MRWRIPMTAPLLLLAACGTVLPGEGGGVIDDPASIAGTWLVTRTLITSPASQPDFPLPVTFPVGFRAQDSWRITVDGQRAVLTSGDSAVNGTFAQGQWVFTYQLDAGSGVSDSATITVTSTSPRMRGGVTHRYATTQRTWLEVWTLDGTKQ